jgi:hypothetical protein
MGTAAPSTRETDDRPRITGMIEGWDRARVALMRERAYARLTIALDARPREEHAPLLAAYRGLADALNVLDDALGGVSESPTTLRAIAATVNEATQAFAVVLGAPP